MFPISYFQVRRFAFCISVLLLSAILIACAPLLPSELESSGNPVVQVTTATAGVSYPGPGATPTPPLLIVPHNDLIATPLPGERVVAGAIVEIPDPQDSLPYTYRAEYTRTLEGFPLHKVFVQYQGQEVRLGDDQGTTNVEATGQKYLTLTYYTYGDETNLPLKSGLYVYEIRTGRLTRIADGRRVSFSEVDGEWVLYTSWDNALPLTQTLGGDAPVNLIPLLAYSIASRETITLSTSLPVIPGRGLPYGVGGNMVGWIEYDVQTQQYAIKVSNLNSRDIQTLNVPDLRHPLFFSFSGELAVWRDTYWHGYSLAQDALFTVPYAPPGWENSSASITVAARHAELEWKVKVNDSEIHYFRALVAPRGQAQVTAWESLVIPSQQTVAPPTPAPLAGTPPVAYP